MSDIFYGEHGTDSYIRNTFYPDYSYKGVMIEIGAGHPTELSLSKHFRDNGWRCICIDANAYYYDLHKEQGHEIYNVACSNAEGDDVTFYIHEEKDKTEMSPMSHSSLGMKFGGAVAREVKVKVTTLNKLLESLGVDKIDFLCLDVEGWEIEVMDGFDVDKYQPKVIVVENFSRNPTYIPYMMDRGYTHNTSLRHNDIYVRSES